VEAAMENQKVFTGFSRSLLPNARSLRKAMTRQERRLWYEFLRDYPIKFYRQRPIDHFILDFYCARARLAVEVDGGQHYEQNAKEYDMWRASVLTKYDLAVLRFSNLDVDREFAAVCEAIDTKVKQRLKD
jgi:very-short-patch-repair endonuclease